ncbi:MAG TPA: glycosyltransferase family 39 protein, partial [Candidatus Saccharimonadia bacterium]|nr:glycosyltransferase family 39 protein [Candidatus Saccharimonadia bacterium]
MSPHYSMVAVNLLLCGAIGVGLYIWQKKLHRKINLFALLILLSVLPLLSLLRPGPYESGDMMLHATRAQPFFDSIMQFHQLPRWAGELNLGYGDTYFEFLYITPYIFTTIFHFLGMSFIDSVKLVLAFPYVLSGVFMYLWIRDEFGEKAGFISAIFYLFAPYHLVDMHFRATVAESASFLFLPLLCWLSSRYLRALQGKFLIFFSLMYGLFLLTHAVIFFTFTPFLLLYILLVWYSRKTRTIRELVFIGLAMVFSMILTAFYWLPVLAETQYIYQSVMSGIEFHPLWFYLISPWMFGFLFQGHHGELSFIVGYTQLLVIGIALYFLRKRIFKTVEKRFVLLCLAFASLFFIMMQSFTLPLWLHLP